MKSSGVIFEHVFEDIHEAVGDLSTLTTLRARTPQRQKPKHAPHTSSWSRLLGLGMVALALGGLAGPLTPRVRLESRYIFTRLALKGQAFQSSTVPAVFDPLKTPDGASIDPVNKEFSLVIPKIGVNAAIIPAVNPTKPGEYLTALQKGIAHSSLSYFPDEDGTVFLFSHSTNYEWFVGDLNAVFYLLKNLEEKDTVVLFYQGTSYTYRITGKQIVKPTAVSYMAPQKGARRLILQTCWPPGSTTERLLIFADLVEESNEKI